MFQIAGGVLLAFGGLFVLGLIAIAVIFWRGFDKAVDWTGKANASADSRLPSKKAD
jgi:hypothetical protein